MQTWQEPTLDIMTFGVEDVVTTSGGPSTGNQGTPWT